MTKLDFFIFSDNLFAISQFFRRANGSLAQDLLKYLITLINQKSQMPWGVYGKQPSFLLHWHVQ